jgi:hypothetical protein
MVSSASVDPDAARFAGRIAGIRHKHNMPDTFRIKTDAKPKLPADPKPNSRTWQWIWPLGWLILEGIAPQLDDCGP